MNVQAIEHKDIKGRKLLYLKITQGEHEVYVNIGEKTYNSVKELEKVQILPFEPDEEVNKSAFTKLPTDEKQEIKKITEVDRILNKKGGNK